MYGIVLHRLDRCFYLGSRYSPEGRYMLDRPKNAMDVIQIRTHVDYFHSCYMVGLKQDRAYGRAAPMGGVVLMLAWLSIVI